MIRAILMTRGGLLNNCYIIYFSGPNVTIDDDDDAGGNGGSPPPGPSHPSSGSGSSRQPHPPPSSVIKKTPQQVAGEAVIGRLVKEVDGVCFSFPCVRKKENLERGGGV